MADRSDKTSIIHNFWRSTENIGQLLDSSPDSMFVSRVDNFRFVDVNARAIKEYGYSREDFMKMHIFDLEIKKPLETEVRKLYDNTPVGEVIEVKGINKRKDGSTFPVQVRFCKLDEKYALANVRDITLQKKEDLELERRVAERTREVREIGLRLAGILDVAEEAIVSVDKDQNIILFNRGAQRIFGYEETEVLGQSIAILLPEAVHSAHRLHIENFSNGPVGSRPMQERREIFGQRKNGEHFPAEASISKVDVENVYFVTAFLRDVTEQRRLEKEVLEISERERRLVGQDLHDDLGQHLTGIGFMGEELEQRMREMGLAEEADRVEKLVKLVEEAKTKTRNLSRGLYPIELATDGLPMVLRDLALQTETIYGITCVVSLDPCFSIESISTQETLYHIAQEAITNAMRHAQPSRIDILLKKEGSGLTMVIKDDGCGLTVDIEKTPGMGLRIMQYRARLIHAELEVEKGPVGGTLVKCTIPIRVNVREKDSL